MNTEQKTLLNSAYVVDSNIGGVDLYSMLINQRVLWRYDEVENGTGLTVDLSKYTSVISSNQYMERACSDNEFIYVAPTTETTASNPATWVMFSRRVTADKMITTPIAKQQLWKKIRSECSPDIARDIFAFLCEEREATPWCYNNKLGMDTYRVITKKRADSALTKFQPGGPHYQYIKDQMDLLLPHDYVTARDIIHHVIKSVWRCIASEPRIFTLNFGSLFFRRWLTMPSSIQYR